MAPEAMIHQNVGIRRRDQADALSSPVYGRASAAPRFGSFNSSNAGTSKTAGPAASISARRQPNACATGPPIAKLRAIPTGTPSIKNESARPRLPAGTMSPIQLVPVGAHAASHTPTPSRDTSNLGSPVSNPA